MIKVQDSSVHKRHVDHIHHRVENPNVSNDQVSEESPLVTFAVEHSEQTPSTARTQNRTDSSSLVTPTI